MAEYIEGWPYVVILEGQEAARFPNGEAGKADAEHYSEITEGCVVDTTPAPRIPEDAKFIHWITAGGSSYYARRDDNGLWETDLGSFITQEDLLGDDWAKNAEIIVLDKR